MLEARATVGDLEADASLKAILDCVALPVWVVDHEGLVVLANPAALRTLGSGDLSELRGRRGHDTVVKHARAGRAWVRLDLENERLPVEIRDNGVGGATMAAGGVGLAGLADRIAALDGELMVTSPAGQGTTLKAEIPLA